jgi:hypothetical protein
VLDLYQRVFDGRPLGENHYGVSADEKPGVQARCRRGVYNATMIHLPVHASRLNDFADLKVLANQLTAFRCADIGAWIDTWIENPWAYVWTRTADQILASIGHYCRRAYDSRPS